MEMICHFGTPNSNQFILESKLKMLLNVKTFTQGVPEILHSKGPDRKPDENKNSPNTNTAGVVA